MQARIAIPAQPDSRIDRILWVITGGEVGRTSVHLRIFPSSLNVAFGVSTEQQFQRLWAPFASPVGYCLRSFQTTCANSCTRIVVMNSKGRLPRLWVTQVPIGRVDHPVVFFRDPADDSWDYRVLVRHREWRMRLGAHEKCKMR